MHRTLFLIACLTLSLGSYAQEVPAYKALPYFLAEIRPGKTLPASSFAPETKPQVQGLLSIGKFHYQPQEPQAVFFNYPFFGISLTYTDFGHSDYLGFGMSLMPFMEINLTPKTRKAFYIKVLSGASYINRVYHEEENPGNLAIGSHINWNFEAFLQYQLFAWKRSDLKIGIGLSHHSNGHTQLPNLGLNSVLFSIGYGIRMKPDEWSHVGPRMIKPKMERTRQLYLSFRTGYGFHEFGGPDRPIGGPDKSIITADLSFGCTFKNVIRARMTLGYRFYQSYFDHIGETESSDYQSKRAWNSSNIHMGFGTELLFGHLGIDAEIGINLFKPYYEVHWELYESIFGDEGTYNIKRTLKVSIGVKGYAISTRKLTRHNAFAAFFINTNYGQADFLELSLGYVVNLGRIRSKGFKP